MAKRTSKKRTRRRRSAGSPEDMRALRDALKRLGRSTTTRTRANARKQFADAILRLTEHVQAVYPMLRTDGTAIERRRRTGHWYCSACKRPVSGNIEHHCRTVHKLTTLHHHGAGIAGVSVGCARCGCGFVSTLKGMAAHLHKQDIAAHVAEANLMRASGIVPPNKISHALDKEMRK